VIAKAKLFEFKADKLHWRTGLRVVVALIVLGVLGLTKYWPAFSAGTFYVGMSDIMTLKDPIGYRMRRLSIITLVGALLTALGLVLGVNWVLAVLSTFLISLLLGASLAWGKPTALAAYFLNIWFIVSLSFQGGAAQALPQALACLIGGVIYMLLALVHFKRQSTPSEPEQGTASLQSPKSLFTTYFALFKFTSPAFQFVLLKALAVAVGTAIGLGFDIPYAHWIPIYTLIILQPDPKETLNIFITVVILLLVDFSTPGSLTDVWARMLNVFIGALIAVVVVFHFLRPSQKKESSTSSVASG